MLDTHTMLEYMRARAHGHVIEAAADDPVLLQAEQDGYADRVGGQWIARSEQRPGERRIARHSEMAGGGVSELN